MIIGITGTFAAGKDTIADFLIEHKRFKAYSLSDEVRYECDDRGLSRERDNLIWVANELRENHGATELARRALTRIKQENHPHVAVTSIRNPAEVDILAASDDFVLVSIDAPVELRYQRSRTRARDGDDTLSLERFIEQEQSEMSDNPNGQQIHKIIERAQHHISNHETFDALFEQVNELLIKLNHER